MQDIPIEGHEALFEGSYRRKTTSTEYIGCQSARYVLQVNEALVNISRRTALSLSDQIYTSVTHTKRKMVQEHDVVKWICKKAKVIQKEKSNTKLKNGKDTIL